ncbi:hypothetical protein BS50DRAFT_156351 [Corynespora cassiicola Philippines]|uniref:Uncharacterized protein n=1 Tax=Corynespora cassiicola Philippines TaxID=1448308 RepID=A0A2T2N711_CORCC|nr:hypothetical protein BS50DRAFT_156351 [Corynespora cassiicola Philippines]
MQRMKQSCGHPGSPQIHLAMTGRAVPASHCIKYEHTGRLFPPAPSKTTATKSFCHVFPASSGPDWQINRPIPREEQARILHSPQWAAQGLRLMLCGRRAHSISNRADGHISEPHVCPGRWKETDSSEKEASVSGVGWGRVTDARICRSFASRWAKLCQTHFEPGRISWNPPAPCANWCALRL